jgi:glycosyltransferase involved in cell wall biosynthesis
VILAKFFGLKAKLVWHDHSGTRIPEESNPNYDIKSLKGGWKVRVYNWSLKLLCRKINFIISVNERLEKWALSYLNFPAEKVVRLNNFPLLKELRETSEIKLPGEKNKRIVLLANVREEKSHLFALKVADEFLENHRDWHFIFVGKHFCDPYFDQFKSALDGHKFKSNLHYLGGRTDVTEILQSCSIGILTSSIEGLPVVILEYGFSGLAVVATDVGQVGEVIKDAGLIVRPGDVIGFTLALTELANDIKFAKQLGEELYAKISKTYSPNVVYKKLDNIYHKTLKINND